MKKSDHGGKRKGAGRKPNPEGQKPKISVTLSKEAIAQLDKAAIAQNISRSELVERYGRNCNLIEEVIKAAQAVIEDCELSEGSSIHAFYSVDGIAMHELKDALIALTGKG